MRKLFALLAIVCAASAMAEQIRVWYCNFEPAEGYHTGQLYNQTDIYYSSSAPAFHKWNYSGGTKKRDIIVNDKDFLPNEDCGSYYVGFNSSESSTKMETVLKFDDVYNQYPEGSNYKIQISWYMYSDGGLDSHSVMFHNYKKGSTSTMNYRIAWVRFLQSRLEVEATKSDKSDKDTFQLNDIPVGWHHFTMILDPANRMIKELTIDNTVVDSVSGTYYYNEIETNKGGDLISGVAIRHQGYYDNFEVFVIPEPGFFGLLAFLGLFFARKQR